jgi:O-antigen/teichoic acid export membrane protein
MTFFGPTSPPVLSEASTPLIRRALHRARIVGNFAFVQAIVQLISFASGILMIRSLDQREYAYFTIANTMQGTLNVLADIGISIGLVSIGGRVWHDRHRFGQLVNTALGLRRRLGLLAALAVVPILYFMLVKNGASVNYTALLIVIVVLGLAFQLSIGVLSVVPRLRSDIGRIQAIDLTGAVARLLGLALLMYLFLNGAVALAIGSATLLLQYAMLRSYVNGVIDPSAAENAEDRVAMKGFIRSQAANAIFFCLQGQITVFLISFFGRNVGSIAEVGALSRLAMIFAVLSHLLANVFAPAFARCQTLPKLRWQYAFIVGAVACFSLVVLGAAALFPRQFLFVLGNKYTHLERELLLMVGGAVISAVASTLWSLNSAKAWIAGSWLYIPLTLATQLALIPSTNFSSVSGVLTFNLVSPIPSLALNLILSYRGFRSFQRTQAQ